MRRGRVAGRCIRYCNHDAVAPFRLGAALVEQVGTPTWEDEDAAADSFPTSVADAAESTRIHFILGLKHSQGAALSGLPRRGVAAISHARPQPEGGRLFRSTRPAGPPERPWEDPDVTQRVCANRTVTNLPLFTDARARLEQATGLKVLGGFPSDAALNRVSLCTDGTAFHQRPTLPRPSAALSATSWQSTAPSEPPPSPPLPSEPPPSPPLPSRPGAAAARKQRARAQAPPKLAKGKSPNEGQSSRGATLNCSASCDQLAKEQPAALKQKGTSPNCADLRRACLLLALPSKLVSFARCSGRSVSIYLSTMTGGSGTHLWEAGDVPGYSPESALLLETLRLQAPDRWRGRSSTGDHEALLRRCAYLYERWSTLGKTHICSTAETHPLCTPRHVELIHLVQAANLDCVVVNQASPELAGGQNDMQKLAPGIESGRVLFDKASNKSIVLYPTPRADAWGGDQLYYATVVTPLLLTKVGTAWTDFALMQRSRFDRASVVLEYQFATTIAFMNLLRDPAVAPPLTAEFQSRHLHLSQPTKRVKHLLCGMGNLDKTEHYSDNDTAVASTGREHAKGCGKCTFFRAACFWAGSSAARMVMASACTLHSVDTGGSACARTQSMRMAL